MTAAPVKAGGQALADGVMMRTPLAWAIARADGTIDVGRNPAARLPGLPVLRILLSLGGALRVGVVRGMLGSRNRSQGASRSRRLNSRFLLAMLLAEAVVWALTRVVASFDPPAWVDLAMAVAPFGVALGIVRVATPSALWRYHGAEHKSVAAHEQGVDLGDVATVARCSRVHNRCGTNLLALMVLVGLLLLPVGGALQVPLFLLGLGAAAEIVTVAARRPRSIVSRLVLAPGRFVQRHLTTAEPTLDELALGCRALEAALAEHAIAELKLAAELAPAPRPLAAATAA